MRGFKIRGEKFKAEREREKVHEVRRALLPCIHQR